MPAHWLLHLTLWECASNRICYEIIFHTWCVSAFVCIVRYYKLINMKMWNGIECIARDITRRNLPCSKTSVARSVFFINASIVREESNNCMHHKKIIYYLNECISYSVMHFLFALVHDFFQLSHTHFFFHSRIFSILSTPVFLYSPCIFVVVAATVFCWLHYLFDAMRNGIQMNRWGAGGAGGIEKKCMKWINQIDM